MKTTGATPIPWNVHDKHCPTRRVLDRTADKWTVPVVGSLSCGTLRGLEREGVVRRKVYASVPPKVEYSLTELGRSLTGLVESVLSAQSAHDAAGATEDEAAD